MSADPRSPQVDEAIQQAAAAWLARRDRELTAAEQDAYLQWLREDARHGAAMARLSGAWNALDQLQEWRPRHSFDPNPDLLAPRRRRKMYWLVRATVAIAAAATLLLVFQHSTQHAPAHRQAIIHPGPERMTLEDGSIIELRPGARVAVNFTPTERNVRLLGGEAYFTVAKHHERPFIVAAGKVSVRAVGTAFTVSLATTEVGVLVTEGTVQVGAQTPSPVTPARESSTATPAAFEPVAVVKAGQQTTVTFGGSATAAPPVVQEVTPAEIATALSWQAMRLEFVAMPLSDVVAEFNRYNRQQMVVADPAAAAIVVEGTLRADNVDAFVRLLEASFGVTAVREGDRILLRKAR